jgi:TonB family protein
MSRRNRTAGGLVGCALVVSFAGAVACSRNPPPATPAPGASGAAAVKGTGQNTTGLNFDPQGADFTVWINAFKNEVYRNWIVPVHSAANFGFRGHVDFEFTVERNGSMSALRMLKSSGTSSLDKPAEFALATSRFLPLPDDYKPPRVTMQVSFFYNEAPAGSSKKNPD